jgi:hypothetical protein
MGTRCSMPRRDRLVGCVGKLGVVRWHAVPLTGSGSGLTSLALTAQSQFQLFCLEKRRFHKQCHNDIKAHLSEGKDIKSDVLVHTKLSP